MFRVLAHDDEGDALTIKLFETTDYLPHVGQSDRVKTGSWNGESGHWDDDAGLFWWEPNLLASELPATVNLTAEVHDQNNDPDPTSVSFSIQVNPFYARPVAPIALSSGSTNVSVTNPEHPPGTGNYANVVTVYTEATGGGYTNTATFDMASSGATNPTFELLEGPPGLTMSSSGQVTYTVAGSGVKPPPSVAMMETELTDGTTDLSTVGRTYLVVNGWTSDPSNSQNGTNVQGVALYDTQIEMAYDQDGVAQPLTFGVGIASSGKPSTVHVDSSKVTVNYDANGKPTTLTYTPDEHWTGSDSFDVWIDYFNPAKYISSSTPESGRENWTPDSIASNKATIYVYDKLRLDGHITLEECGCGCTCAGGIRSQNGSVIEYEGTPSISLRYDSGSLYIPVLRGSGQVNHVIEDFPEQVDPSYAGITARLAVAPIDDTGQVQYVNWTGSLNGLYPGDSFAYETALDALSLPGGEYRYSLDLKLNSGASLSVNHGSFEVAGDDGDDFPPGWDASSDDHLRSATSRSGSGNQISMPAGVHWVTGSGERHFFVEEGTGIYRPTNDDDRSTLTDERDGNNNVTSYTISNKYGEKIVFDGDGKILRREDATGTAYAMYSYDSGNNNRLDKIYDRNGRETSLVYSGTKLTGIQEKRNNSKQLTTTIQYDTNNRITKIIQPDPDGTGGAAAPETEWTYNGDVITSTTDPNDNTGTFTYDGAGRASGFENPDGSIIGIVSARAAADLPSWTIDNSDALTIPLGPTTPGQFSVEWDERGNPTFAKRDRFGNLLEQIDANGVQTRYYRNNRGEVLRQVESDPDGAGPLEELVTDHNYDDLGNLIYTRHPDGSEEFWTYDPTFSVMTYHKDPAGVETSYTVNSSTGLVTEERRLGVAGMGDDEVTTYTYVTGYGLPGGLIDVVTDPVGTQTKYFYFGQNDGVTSGDARFGQIKQVIQAYGTSEALARSYTYDDYGFLATETTPLGTTNYNYDMLGRLVMVAPPDPDGASALPRMKTVYTYDSVGNLVTEQAWEFTGSSPLRVTTHIHDVMNRRIKTQLPAPDPAAPTVYPELEWHYTDGLLDWSEDPLDRRTSYTYDSIGRVATQTAPDPDGTGTTYQSLVTTYSYDDAGNLVSESVDVGAANPIVTSHQYDALHRRVKTSLPDADGSGTTYTAVDLEWNYVDGRLASSTDALGAVTDYEYDVMGRLTATIPADPDGAGPAKRVKTNTIYDKAGRPITEQIVDHGTGNVLRTVAQYEYDVRGNLTKTTLAPPDTGQPTVKPVLEWHYSTTTGLLDWSDDALDRRTHYFYDNLGRTTKVMLPDPDTTNDVTTNTNRPVMETKFDKFGNLFQSIDANGNVTEYIYDDLDRRTTTKLPPPDPGTPSVYSTITATYDLAGQMTEMVDADGIKTTRTYLDTGSVATQTTSGETTPNNWVTIGELTFGYDTAGNQTSVTNKEGETTTYGYDDLFRRSWMEEPDNTAQQRVEYTYYNDGQLKSLTDPEGNATTFTYDNLGRKVAETNALSDTRTFRYDDFGNLDRRVDRNGRVIDYIFDGLDRLTEEDWFEDLTDADANPPVTPEREFHLTYDLAGQLDQIYDQIGSTVQSKYTYDYDRLGRMLEEDNTGSTAAPTIELTYPDYDKGGNRETVRAKIGTTNDFETTYQYDGRNRVERIEQAGQTGGNTVAEKLVLLKYDGNGQYTEIDRYKDTSGGSTNRVVLSTYDRTDAGRLKEIVHQNRYGLDVALYEWTYDDAGRIATYKYDNNHGADHAQDYTYVYDDNGQLTEVWNTDEFGQSGTNPVEAYSYDSAGNRDSASGSDGNNGNYTNDTANRVSYDGTFTYPTDPNSSLYTTYGPGYDDEGNRILRIRDGADNSNDPLQPPKFTIYEYDHRNRLVKVTEKDQNQAITQTVEYRYDVHGRRIAKIVDEDGAGSATAEETRYVYDGQQVALVFDGNNTLLYRYLHGPGIDEMLAHEKIADGTVGWSITDHQGSVRQIIDSEGLVKAIIDYDAFGNPELVTTLVSDVNGDGIIDAADAGVSQANWGNATTRHAEGDVNRDGIVDSADTGYMFAEWGAATAGSHELFLDILGHTELYTGREFDAEIGLQYNRARYYDAKVGRWISEDPIGFAAGDYNVNRYVGNSPTNATDPTGLRAEWHHLVPRKWRKYFKVRGYDVDAAENGWIIDEYGHRRTPTGGMKLEPDWGTDWDAFFAKHNNRPSVPQARQFLSEMKKRYGQVLRQGKQATVSYRQWGTLIGKMRQAANLAVRTGCSQSVRFAGSIAGKAAKGTVVVTFVINATRDGVVSAAEGAVQDGGWPWIDVAQVAANEAGDAYNAIVESGRLDRRLQSHQIDRIHIDPFHAPIGRRR